MDIGRRLKEERERLGYSQTDFAALGGASKGSQIAWEKGSAYPNAAFLSSIASAGADVNYVLTGGCMVQKNEPGLGVIRAAIEEIQAWQVREQRYLSPEKFAEAVFTLCEIAEDQPDRVKTAAPMVLRLVA